MLINKLNSCKKMLFLYITPVSEAIVIHNYALQKFKDLILCLFATY